MSKSIKFLAYYLPQYHPIPENDEWWGKGFTEWSNVTKAKPLFKNHNQPILPSDLGFYDLRVPEVRREQAKLAMKYGVDGFIYYQYFFGNGKMLLEKPAENMLKDKKVKLPFCFCWANESWKGIWHGLDDSKILIEQTYNGIEDYIQYFNYLLPFFKDERYIKVDDKPMFHVYRMEDIPDLDTFIKLFNNLAIKEGFKGVYFVSTIVSDMNKFKNNIFIYGQVGLDVFMKMRYKQGNFFEGVRFLGKIERKIKSFLRISKKIEDRKKPKIIDYKIGVKNLNLNFINKKYIPCVFPNWDNSARSGNKALIFKNSSPKEWRKHLQLVVKELQNNTDNPPYVIIKSWNEWAEGNYLEPDLRYGHKWLEIIKDVKINL